MILLCWSKENSPYTRSCTDLKKMYKLNLLINKRSKLNKRNTCFDLCNLLWWIFMWCLKYLADNSLLQIEQVVFFHLFDSSLRVHNIRWYFWSHWNKYCTRTSLLLGRILLYYLKIVHYIKINQNWNPYLHGDVKRFYCKIRLTRLEWSDIYTTCKYALCIDSFWYRYSFLRFNIFICLNKSDGIHWFLIS